MDTQKIDLVALNEKDNKVNLVIMDDQNWDDARSHIDMIHEKILTYVAYIENGTLLKHYPSAIGIEVAIKVVFEQTPSEEGQAFIASIHDILDDIGYNIEFVDYTSL